MKYLKVNDKHEMSAMAADIMAAQVKEKPDSVLGLATGSTPIEMYDMLAKMNLDFSKVTTVNLDEYVGAPVTDVNSYRYFMNDNLFSKINIKIENTNLPNGMAENPAAECERYNAVLEKVGTRDIQLLGVGLNGHIGFVEPNDNGFKALTSVVDLTDSTIEANSRFYASKELVPKQAFTMGVQQIFDAKHILLIANGTAKIDILEKAFSGIVTTKIPASLLQLHPNVTVIVAEK